MYAVDFCELLLFDEHKQAYHMVQYAFDKKSALQAFIRYETLHRSLGSFVSSLHPIFVCMHPCYVTLLSLGLTAGG